MKKRRNRAVAMLLALMLSLSLFSCGGETADSGRDGIYISDEQPYSAEAVAYAEQTFYSLLQHYTRASGVQTIPEATLARLGAVAAELVAISAESPITESVYIAVMDKLRESGEAVIDEYYAYSQNGTGELARTRELYLSLVSLLNADTVSRMAYRFLLYGYDYRYGEEIGKSEKYPEYKEMYEARAEAIDAERRALVMGIGEGEFSSALLQALALSELISGGVLDSDEMSGFTDGEILIFIKSLELSATDIDDEGWCLILDKILPGAAGENYGTAQLFKMRENRDFEKISAVMNDLSAIIAAVSERVTAEDIALLRADKTEQLLRNTLKRFTDDDLARLARVFSVDINKEDYHSVALSFYGAEYAEYAENIQPITQEELRASLDGETFYESLERYIAGLSPALSYGMRK